MIIHHTFTVSLWVRARLADGNLFSVNLNDNSATGAENFLNMGLTTGYRPQMTIK